MDNFGVELLKMIEERFGKTAATGLLFLVGTALAVAAIGIIFTVGVVPITDFLKAAFDPSLTKKEVAQFVGRALIYLTVSAFLAFICTLVVYFYTTARMRQIDRRMKRAMDLVAQAEGAQRASLRIMGKMKKAVMVAPDLRTLQEIFENEDFSLGEETAPLSPQDTGSEKQQ